MTRILVVDDDEQITTLFEKYLKSGGYDTLSVNDSSLAVDIALSFQPHLFILDLMMPEPDGFKLCRQLRNYTRFSKTPILIVTALGDEDSKVVAFGAGANDYLIKPFFIDELSSRVQSLLNKKEE